MVLLVSASPSSTCVAQSQASTRVSRSTSHHRTGKRSYPYRARKDYVLRELDLHAGDVVVDIGAGDGWWSEHFGKAVGKTGVVHAAEVDKMKVDKMKEKYAETPQIRPFLCQKDSTTLPENSCDLAFLSQSFHHLDLKGRVEYLSHLRKVVKPTGRVIIIEKYARVAGTRQKHGTDISVLSKEAEETGWILVRYELMVGTYHYLAIFVQKDLFPPERERKKRRRIRL